MLHFLFILMFETIWFFLPALLANAAPAVSAKFCQKNKFLQKLFSPISILWLGKNKTYAGWTLGVLTAILVVVIQGRSIVVGLIMGIGTMTGDSVKSFFKRRFQIEEGKYIIWDTIDWLLGTLFLLSITKTLPEKQIIIMSIFICPLIVAVVNFIAFKLKIKRSL
jgi:CDP-diglyceride synthetase